MNSAQIYAMSAVLIYAICAGHKEPAAGRREMINIMFAHADRMGFFIEENHETKETKWNVHELRVEQL